MAEDTGNIKVCVRVRCFIKEEINGSRSKTTSLCIAMPTKTTVVLLGRPERVFEFDRAYWSHSQDHPLYADQETLQAELGVAMIAGALEGYNNCIFAYGQTGSGKSYSVLGGAGPQRGLLPRVCEGLIDQVRARGPEADAKMLVSFVEIYNEMLLDLLDAGAVSHVAGGSGTLDRVNSNTAPKSREHLQIKTHPVLGIIIPGLTEAPVKTAEEILFLVDYGSANRQTSATAMNASSSRSHCVFTFKINMRTESGNGRFVSATNLVDLAGSERSKRTGATDERLKEGAAINQSLSTLARVISELAKASKKGIQPPFRDSKLTMILKESLSGNSKTFMMAAISPNAIDYEETLSTIKFAQSVKLIQTNAVCNVVKDAQAAQMLEQLQAELESLRLELVRTTETQMDQDHTNAKLQARVDEQKEILATAQAFFGTQWEEFMSAERVVQRRRSALHIDNVRRISKLEEMLSEGASADDTSAESEESVHDSLLRSHASSVFGDDNTDGSGDADMGEVLLRWETPAGGVALVASAARPEPRSAAERAANAVRATARSQKFARLLTAAKEAERRSMIVSSTQLDHPRLHLRPKVAFDPDTQRVALVVSVLWRYEDDSAASEETLLQEAEFWQRHDSGALLKFETKIDPLKDPCFLWKLNGSCACNPSSFSFIKNWRWRRFNVRTHPTVALTYLSEQENAEAKVAVELSELSNVATLDVITMDPMTAEVSELAVKSMSSYVMALGLGLLGSPEKARERIPRRLYGFRCDFNGESAVFAASSEEVRAHWLDQLRLAQAYAAAVAKQAYAAAVAKQEQEAGAEEANGEVPAASSLHGSLLSASHQARARATKRSPTSMAPLPSAVAAKLDAATSLLAGCRTQLRGLLRETHDPGEDHDD
eukprot:TRINITY_DN2526_c0_g1_i3.p1 TRINITY_DN2526_c0_g1~~TRINITY_DN2526_c0_g1_i3.p1  ORF type:complete len:889 (-),score=227.36 TRINITY_DN2526_c0_g1_i3:68-2734(-)